VSDGCMTPFCRIRRFLGLTQDDVAAVTGISIRRLPLAERGAIQLLESEECAVRAYLEDELKITSKVQGTDHEPPARAVSAEVHA
jgi:transcriptional regulator with XRE-family HTH domain